MHQVLESSRKPELSEAAASSRRQKGQFVNAWFVTVLRKKVLDIGLDPGLRHPATPQAYVFDKSTLLRRSRDQHPFVQKAFR
ncbi:unnamed protein product [Sphagnum troendelagicum]